MASDKRTSNTRDSISVGNTRDTRMLEIFYFDNINNSTETSWIFLCDRVFQTASLKNVNLTELKESVVHFKNTLLSNTNSVPINELKWSSVRLNMSLILAEIVYFWPFYSLLTHKSPILSKIKHFYASLWIISKTIAHHPTVILDSW